MSAAEGECVVGSGSVSVQVPALFWLTGLLSRMRVCMLQTKRLLTSVSDSTCTLLAEQSVLVSTRRCTELQRHK